MVAVGSRHDSIQLNDSHLQFISLPPNHALLSWLSRPYCRDPMWAGTETDVRAALLYSSPIKLRFFYKVVDSVVLIVFLNNFFFVEIYILIIFFYVLKIIFDINILK
jgi:hypothetical protein